MDIDIESDGKMGGKTWMVGGWVEGRREEVPVFVQRSISSSSITINPILICFIWFSIKKRVTRVLPISTYGCKREVNGRNWNPTFLSNSQKPRHLSFTDDENDDGSKKAQSPRNTMFSPHEAKKAVYPKKHL